MKSLNNIRIFVCEFLQESNSFNPVLTDFDDFSSRGIYFGDELVNSNGKAGETIDGMLTCLKENNVTAVGGVRMSSGSGGRINSKTVVDYFRKNNIKLLKSSEKLDGILISMHGASLSDKSNDVCGDILEEIRSVVGEDMPIAVSFDLHANITDKISKNADYVCGYQTYPHIDIYNVGYRAASVLLRHINGKKSSMAKVSIPMMAPAHGYTTTKGLLSKLMKRATAMVESGKIIDFSIFQVQPWMDINDISSSVVVIADDKQVAKLTAKDLAKEDFNLRKKLLGKPLYTPDEVIKLALENNSQKPIVLVDSADSSNAGANGDSAAVIEYLIPHSDSLSAALTVLDINAVKQAFEIGIGATCDFTFGASLAPKLTKPITIKNAKVKSLHDGKFLLFGPAERGKERDLGKSAVIEYGKLKILITSRSQNAGDLNYYRSFGIEPALCNLVCVKACTSFRAGYLPITPNIYNTITPGAACPILTNLTFRNLPKPFFPFNKISEKNISEAKCLRG